MWGNKLGWGISAAIFVVIVGTLVMFEASDTISAPTSFGKDSKNFESMEFPVPASSVVKMEDACDATDSYRQAIDDYAAHASAYDDFTTSPRDLSDVLNLKGIDLLVKGTHCSEMKLMSGNPEKYINYESDKPDVDALRVLGKAANNAGLLAQQAGNAADATKYYEAAFALGYKMFRERVLYVELLAGLDMMAGAAQQLETLAKAGNDATREKEVGDFRKAFVDYRNDRILPMARVITSIDENVINQYAGDIFVLAQNSKDRMWRTEAILKLGRYKWNAGGSAGRSADQRGAKRMLRQMTEDPDALVRTAAKAGNELTVEDYHRLH